MRVRMWLSLIFVLTAASAAQAQSTFRIDPARTNIGFVIDAVGFPQTRGEFRQFTGRLSIDFDRPARSRVTFNVMSGSLDTRSHDLDDYIRGPGFLNVGQFPTIAFTSTGVEKLDGRTVNVTGDLTMLGKTRPAVFTVTVARKGNGPREPVGFHARGIVQRSQFGMINGQPLISDDVAITVSTEALPE